MSRAMTTAMLDAITAPSFQPAILVSFSFNTGSPPPTTVNVWSGWGPLTWNSMSFLGLGQLLALGQIEDGSTVEAKGVTVEVSGIDPTLLPDALSDLQLGLPATIWLAAMSGPGSVVADPVILWSGAMDQPSFDIGPDEVKLSISLESLLSVMDVAIDRRYTLDDSQMTWPGDLGLSFVLSIIDLNIAWGAVGAKTEGVRI